MFLKNKNSIFKIRRSKVTDYAALMGKKEAVAFLSLSSYCLVIAVLLFLVVPWVCLQFVIVVFPGNTHLLFLMRPFSPKCSLPI